MPTEFQRLGSQKKIFIYDTQRNNTRLTPPLYGRLRGELVADKPRPPPSMPIGPAAAGGVGPKRPQAGGPVSRPYKASTAVSSVVTRPQAGLERPISTQAACGP